MGNRDTFDDTAELAPGSVIDGRYRIVGELGRGGMSTVVEAEVLLGLRVPNVALKVLHPALAEDQESIARLLREADVVRSLRHPRICAIYDLGRTPSGRPYLVLEKLDGQSLADRIDEGPLTPEEAAEILLPVFGALDAAHRQNVIHRDLKPENIVVWKRGRGYESKLLDFGVARLFGLGTHAERLTSYGVVMGTPSYMAPEQARGEGGLDPRIDVWAAGVILYEMLTGERPFVATNYNALLVQILTRPPKDVRVVVPGLSPLVAMVVEKALAKRREDRFASMREFGDALRIATADGRSSDLDEPTVALGAGGSGSLDGEDTQAGLATIPTVGGPAPAGLPFDVEPGRPSSDKVLLPRSFLSHVDDTETEPRR